MTQAMESMMDLAALIKEHNARVRRVSENRWRYRTTCANCENNAEQNQFAPHELRRRTLRYPRATEVVCAEIWLARWKCRQCGRTFTDYPDFRTAV